MATTCQVQVAMSTQPAVLLHSTVVPLSAMMTAVTSLPPTPGILPLALRTVLHMLLPALAGKTITALGTLGSRSSAQLRAAGCSRCNAKFTTLNNT